MALYVQIPSKDSGVGIVNFAMSTNLTVKTTAFLYRICLNTPGPRGSVRSTRVLGPTMTARGQSIGISIGMLPQTLIMSITV